MSLFFSSAGLMNGCAAILLVPYSTKLAYSASAIISRPIASLCETTLLLIEFLKLPVSTGHMDFASFTINSPASLKDSFITTASLSGTPLNILSNKLTAIIGRDEPKDIFDIIHLSLSFSFNWLDVFELTKQKAVINEIDVEQRLVSFPIQWLENVNWLNNRLDIEFFGKALSQIADDFLLGKQNSLGYNKTAIEMAKPHVIL